VYVTGDITVEDVVRLNANRVGGDETAEDYSRLALPNHED
jgi:amidophosphoribosyltransferase